MDNIEFNLATIIGNSHLQKNINNQDSVVVIDKNDYFVGIVCDGCSGGKHSEVGAKLISSFLVNKIDDFLSKHEKSPINIILKYLEDQLIAYIKNIIYSNGDEIKSLSDFFLSTILGVIITQEKVYIFSAGDGYIKLNEIEEYIDQNNIPMYFAFNILSKDYKQKNNIDEYIPLKLMHDIDFEDFENLIISTDGIDVLKYKKDNTFKVLGVDKKVDDVNQFIENEKFFSNKVLMQKRLNILGKNKVFDDDTTFVVVKKKKE